MILATNQDPTSVSMKIIKWLLDPACHAYGYGHDKYDLATNKTTIFQHMMKFWLYIPSFGYGQILVWLVRACIKKKKKNQATGIFNLSTREASTGHMYRGC